LYPGEKGKLVEGEILYKKGKKKKNNLGRRPIDGRKRRGEKKRAPLKEKRKKEGVPSSGGIRRESPRLGPKDLWERKESLRPGKRKGEKEFYRDEGDLRKKERSFLGGLLNAAQQGEKRKTSPKESTH